jgi:hypothetical protein
MKISLTFIKKFPAKILDWNYRILNSKAARNCTRLASLYIIGKLIIDLIKLIKSRSKTEKIVICSSLALAGISVPIFCDRGTIIAIIFELLDMMHDMMMFPYRDYA